MAKIWYLGTLLSVHKFPNVRKTVDLGHFKPILKQTRCTCTCIDNPKRSPLRFARNSRDCWDFYDAPWRMIEKKLIDQTSLTDAVDLCPWSWGQLRSTRSFLRSQGSSDFKISKKHKCSHVRYSPVFLPPESRH